MSSHPVYFHVDLDAFFAAVEQLDNPSYRGFPVIVGGEVGKRGVVSTCSYEARKFGVHSAMPMARAVQLCPSGIFLRGRMHRYHEKSQEVMAVFGRFSPIVQQMSVDEAFLDMTGTYRLFGPAQETAQSLKDCVRRETGLTVSVGVASNKYIAKIASGLSKPDGLVTVQEGNERAFMESLRVKDLWGIGEKTRDRLAAAGLKTVQDIVGCPPKVLSLIIGPSGSDFLKTVLSGVDPGLFEGEASSRSISTERTFETDIESMPDLETVLLELSQELMFRLLDENLHSRTVHLKIRYSDFTTVSIQETGEQHINDSEDLYKRARMLLGKKYVAGQAVRLLGIGLQKVSDTRDNEQMDLFDDGTNEKKRKVEKALHSLAVKRGKRMVTRARLIGKPGDE